MNVLSKRSVLSLVGMSVAVTIGGFVGCGGDDSVAAINGDDGGASDGSSNDGGSGDGSSNPDGAPNDDGGITDGGSDGGPRTKSIGYVVFNQTNTAGPFYNNSASAAFSVLPASYDLECAGFGTVTKPTASTASCSIKVCTDPVSADAGTVDAGDAGPVIAPNTGDITLKSAVDTTGFVLAANANGTYTTATATGEWWAAADNTVEVKSNGSTGSIPPFDDAALIGPGDISQLKFNGNNAPPTIGTTAFDRGTALAITYSGGTTGTKLRVLLTTTSSAQKSIIACDFDAANGVQSIAAADLGHLEQANNAGIAGAFTAQARTIKTTTAGDFTFNVTLGAATHSGAFTNTN